jgi:hypothetical protein
MFFYAISRVYIQLIRNFSWNFTFISMFYFFLDVGFKTAANSLSCVASWSSISSLLALAWLSACFLICIRYPSAQVLSLKRVCVWFFFCFFILVL